MKKTNFPLKKIFEQDFIKKDKKLFTLKYNQATINEYYEFMDMSIEEQNKELYVILTKSIKDSLKIKFMYKYKLNKLNKILDIEELMMNILKNRYRAYKSIFNGIRKKSNGKGSIDSVGLSAICKAYIISPTDLMNNYTLEQYLWFLDGVEWINNSQDKEGQSINNLAIVDREAVAKRAKENKRAFDKIRKK